MSATISNIKRHAGIAGQYSVSVTVEYSGESPAVVTFVAHVHGGPVVMILPSGIQTFISKDVTDRLGSAVDEQWIMRFF